MKLGTCNPDIIELRKLTIFFGCNGKRKTRNQLKSDLIEYEYNEDYEACCIIRDYLDER